MSSTALFCGNLEPQEVMPGPAFGVGTTVAVRGSCAATAMLVFKAELPRVDPEVPNEKIISTQSLTSETDELLDVEVPAGALGMRVSIENTSGTKITFDVEFTVKRAVGGVVGDVPMLGEEQVDIVAMVDRALARPLTGLSLWAPHGIAEEAILADQDNTPLGMIQKVVIEAGVDAVGVKATLTYPDGRTRTVEPCALLPVPAWQVNTGPRVEEPARTLNASSPETAKAAISDLEVWGDPDMVKLIAKASSRQQGFMKTMKAVDLGGGVIVQFETQQRCGDTSTGEMHSPIESGGPAMTLAEAQAKYHDFIVLGVEEKTFSGIRHNVVTYKHPGSEWALSQSAVYVPGARIEEAAQAEKGVTARKLVVPTAAEAVEKISASLTAMGEQVGAAFGQAMQKELT
jgi:hypothetical protein